MKRLSMPLRETHGLRTVNALLVQGPDRRLECCVLKIIVVELVFICLRTQGTPTLVSDS
jgi:hypothetical protein